MEPRLNRLNRRKTFRPCECPCENPERMRTLAARERDENPGDWFRCQCKACGTSHEGCTVKFHFVWKIFSGDYCEMCNDCDGSGEAKSSEKDTVPDGNSTLRKSCRQRSRPPAGAKTVPSFSTAESSAMESREPAQSSSNAASTLGQAVEATMTSNMLKVTKRYKPRRRRKWRPRT